MRHVFSARLAVLFSTFRSSFDDDLTQRVDCDVDPNSDHDMCGDCFRRLAHDIGHSGDCLLFELLASKWVFGVLDELDLETAIEFHDVLSLFRNMRNLKPVLGACRLLIVIRAILDLYDLSFTEAL